MTWGEGRLNFQKLLIRIIRLNYVNGHYEFLRPLARLMREYRRFERTVWALNAIIIAIAIYALMQYLGLTTLMKFYYQDSFILSALPAIVSIISGVALATFFKRRKKADVFPLLGSELSEKAKTAFDNKDLDSLPMQSLAEELKLSLAGIKPSQILDRRQLSGRVMTAILLSAVVALLAQGNLVETADLQSIIELKDRAAGIFQEDKPQPDISQNMNLSENLFGNPSLAVLNENKLPLVLSPGTGAGSIPTNTKPVERVFQQSQAGEAAAVPSELYIESLPPENREIIKNYFTLLSQSD